MTPSYNTGHSYYNSKQETKRNIIIIIIIIIDKVGTVISYPTGGGRHTTHIN